MFVALAGLPEFTERSINGLNEFCKKNNISKVYGAFWYSTPQDIMKIEKFKSLINNAEVFPYKHSLPFKLGRFKWLDLEDYRFEQQYYLKNWLLNEQIKTDDNKCVMYRADMEWEVIPDIRINVNNNTILTTPIEGHEYVPFEPVTFNDQFYIADFNYIKKLYSTFFVMPTEQLYKIHSRNKYRFSPRHSPLSHKGIEGLLFELNKINKMKVKYCYGFYRFASKPKLKRFMLFLNSTACKLPCIFFIFNKPSRLNLLYIINYIISKFYKVKNPKRANLSPK